MIDFNYVDYVSKFEVMFTDSDNNLFSIKSPINVNNYIIGDFYGTWEYKKICSHNRGVKRYFFIIHYYQPLMKMPYFLGAPLGQSARCFAFFPIFFRIPTCWRTPSISRKPLAAFRNPCVPSGRQCKPDCRARSGSMMRTYGATDKSGGTEPRPGAQCCSTWR